MCLCTDEHRDNFRNQYPDSEEFQISNPEGLVSYASVTISNRHVARAAVVVDDQGNKAVCLILVTNRSRLADMRWRDGFMTEMETALGITGERYYSRQRV